MKTEMEMEGINITPTKVPLENGSKLEWSFIASSALVTLRCKINQFYTAV